MNIGYAEINLEKEFIVRDKEGSSKKYTFIPVLVVEYAYVLTELAPALTKPIFALAPEKRLDLFYRDTHYDEPVLLPLRDIELFDTAMSISIYRVLKDFSARNRIGPIDVRACVITPDGEEQCDSYVSIVRRIEGVSVIVPNKVAHPLDIAEHIWKIKV